MSPHVALVTLLTVIVITIAMGLVGRARGRDNVKAPAIIGPPEFERTFRAHQNTLEQSVMFLPVWWVLANFSILPTWEAVLGYVWVAARMWYVVAYIQDAAKRGMAFLVASLAFTALLLMALVGVGMAMLPGL